jgi:hypothetical protein
VRGVNEIVELRLHPNNRLNLPLIIENMIIPLRLFASYSSAKFVR